MLNPLPMTSVVNCCSFVEVGHGLNKWALPADVESTSGLDFMFSVYSFRGGNYEGGESIKLCWSHIKIRRQLLLNVSCLFVLLKCLFCALCVWQQLFLVWSLTTLFSNGWCWQWFVPRRLCWIWSGPHLGRWMVPGCNPREIFLVIVFFTSV